jgi:manganese transport protein
MLIGWAINSAMIVVAASVFYTKGTLVTELSQAQETLKPLMGDAAAVVFALALLLAGFASSITAGIAGGSIFAGISGEPFDVSDNHSRLGVLITLAGGLLVIFFLRDPFQGIIWSQIFLSMQLPLTVFGLISLTSSVKVMGKFANSYKNRIVLWSIAVIVSLLNIMLVMQLAS